MSVHVYTYPRPMLTVDAVIFSGTVGKWKVVLIKRKNDPFSGCWALPGGFVDQDESLEAAVTRELCEETGLSGILLNQFHAFGDPGRDPRGHSVTVAYWGLLYDPVPLHAADDAAEAVWFDVNALPSMAFDHETIINTALHHLETRTP